MEVHAGGRLLLTSVHLTSLAMPMRDRIGGLYEELSIGIKGRFIGLI